MKKFFKSLLIGFLLFTNNTLSLSNQNQNQNLDNTNLVTTKYQQSIPLTQVQTNNHNISTIINSIDISKRQLNENITSNINSNTNLKYIEISDLYIFILFYGLLTISIVYTILCGYNHRQLSIFFNRTILLLSTKITISVLTFILSYTVMWLSFLVFFIVNYKNKEIVLLYSGHWLCINIASSMLPVSRNSIWTIICGFQQKNMILIHKYISLLCLTSIMIKIIVVLIYTNYDFVYLFAFFDYKNGGSPFFGTITSISISILSTIALPFFRKKYHEIYLFTHRFLSISIIITSSLHYPISVIYLSPTVALYIIDLVLRYCHVYKAIYSDFKTFSNSKTQYTLISLTLTKEIKQITPGSYFFICDKTISILEWHSFSLISRINDTLIFLVKNNGPGTWTDKMCKKEFKIKRELSRHLKQQNEIYLQGPYQYSSVNYFNKSKYKYIVCISAGIAVTPIISILQNINEEYLKGNLSHIHKIVFIWVSNSLLIKPFITIISSLSQNLFRLEIYSTNKYQNEDDDEYEIINNILFFVNYDKPNISSIVNTYINDYRMSSNEVCVICTGPDNLTNEVTKICSNLNLDLTYN